MKGCYSVLKYLLVIFNLIFWVLGIAGCVFGVWMLVDPTFFVSLPQEASDYKISLIILLVASILLVIVAGLGIYGSLKESQCALTTFFSLLLIIFVAEVSAGLWIWINSDSLELRVKNAAKLTVEKEYHVDDNKRNLFDTFQRNLHCCGVDKPTDWMGEKQVVVAVSSNPGLYDIPSSCCRENRSPQECQIATKNVKIGSAIDYGVIYSQGCYNSIVAKLKEYGCYILWVGVTVATIQILGLIFSLVLAFAVNRSNRYKA